VNDAPPMIVVNSLGPTLPDEGRTLVLLSHQLHTPDGFEVDADDRSIVHMVPLFDEPGTVRLTLLSEKGKIGTEVVTVRACDEEAIPAMRLMFPPLLAGQGVRDARDATWVQFLLASSDTGSAPSESHLQQLHDELPIVKKHPDWAEICEMRLARIDAFRYLSNRETELEVSARDFGPDAVPAESPLPESVAQALKSDLTSAFAKAIQGQIRSRVEGHKLLLRHWRGEPLIVPSRPPETKP